MKQCESLNSEPPYVPNSRSRCSNVSDFGKTEKHPRTVSCTFLSVKGLLEEDAMVVSRLRGRSRARPIVDGPVRAGAGNKLTREIQKPGWG